MRWRKGRAIVNLVRAVPRRAIKKLLVANRGEIALRVIRSARTAGLETVAVFAQPDRGAPHVVAADEAYLLGPAPAADSYLNIAAIIQAAQSSGADAIHPGYGFLSERPEFVRAITDAGMIFIGPPAEVMAALGDKVSARRLARRCGVPVVPGIETGDLASARDFAAQVGYPILVKAAAGGGGRGMRTVENEAALGAALEAAAREAQAAFGEGRIFVEKYLARPRHVEVQLLGDDHGQVFALGDRDCSIQRRHQKLIEESPAPGLGPELRTRMADAAVRLASAAGYRNAGTVEFLVDGVQFYFLEVNARLQVEHPVTEIRFGCDLVAEQLRIAAGEKLVPPPEPRGCAIECRINAEDAEQGFRPTAGRVLYLHLPAGAGVRVDTFLEPGIEITSYYDDLIAKVICHAATREEARRRMMLALAEFSLAGVSHTTAFLHSVVASESFARGDLSTRFIGEHFAGWAPTDDERDAALIAATLVANRTLGASPSMAGSADGRGARADGSPWGRLGEFRLCGTR